MGNDQDCKLEKEGKTQNILEQNKKDTLWVVTARLSFVPAKPNDRCCQEQ